MLVLWSLYKSPEHPLDLRKDGLDTRLFTSTLCIEASQVWGGPPPHPIPVWLGLLRLLDLSVSCTLAAPPHWDEEVTSSCDIPPIKLTCNWYNVILTVIYWTSYLWWIVNHNHCKLQGFCLSMMLLNSLDPVVYLPVEESANVSKQNVIKCSSMKSGVFLCALSSSVVRRWKCFITLDPNCGPVHKLQPMNNCCHPLWMKLHALPADPLK